MSTTLIIVFLLGYAAITMEHPLKINKSATAILLAVFCWIAILFLPNANHEEIIPELSHHLSSIAEIAFFLMGAMTIVELIDAHRGFRIVNHFLNTKSKTKLLWLISMLTFFLSAVLDNLTTAIVVVSILRKMVDDKNERMIFSSMVIIAANAGGAWSPIGDVTTTMLWIGGQVTALNIMLMLIIPSLVSMLVPLLFFSFSMKGKNISSFDTPGETPQPYSIHIFILGVMCLLSVPVFKQLTHLPPYMGILFGLGIMWVVTELLHSKTERKNLQVASVLTKIDLTSILFFVGILLAVAALESAGILVQAADWLNEKIPNQDITISFLGIASAIIDNVPLVAASMAMYPLDTFAADHKIWEMIAYCAGTGGSLLIIGSAAGVVVMGMEKISFGWYLKKISLPALVGYATGVACYLGIYSMMHS